MKKKDLLNLVAHSKKDALRKQKQAWTQQSEEEAQHLLATYEQPMKEICKNLESSLTSLMKVFDELSTDPAVNFDISGDYSLSCGFRSMCGFEGLNSLHKCCDFDSPKLTQINSKFRNQIDNIERNYDIVTNNVSSMTTKEATEYLSNLGFQIQKEAIQQALVKPVDTSFLFLDKAETDSKE